jgi:hypothetical protein
MFSSGATPRGAAVVAASPMRGSREVDEIVGQLVARASIRQRKPAPYVPALYAVRRLASAADGMTAAQKRAAQAKLAQGLKHAHPNPLDARLLQDVVHRLLEPGQSGSLNQLLARTAFERLSLPSLTLREKGEAEPNSRTFNSTLPSFAESTYDYGPLGRTLLWEGARHLFDGPSGAARARRLKTVIFSLANPPAPGKPKLEGPLDFVAAVDALNVYEPVDVESLRRRQKVRQPV